MVPRTVLTRSSLISLNETRRINTVQPRTVVNNAGPMKNVINNAYSTTRRPFKKITTADNSNFNKSVNTVNDKNINAARPNAVVNTARPKGNPQQDLKDKGVIDSGCSRHMTGNISYLTDYKEIDGGFVAFGGNSKGGKITGNGKIRTDFKLTDESHVLLKVPRKDNMYSVDLKNVVPQGGLTCLFVKVTPDESNLWHRKLGHVNFKTMNKLVKGNLVRGLPTKRFEINQTCVAYQKGKQHKASCIENLINLKVKVIRCDNRTEFKNKIMNQFCEMKGYSTNSKAFRVFNSRTRIVEENLHVHFSETTPNIEGSRSNWLFDIDALTKSMNYKPVVAGNQSNGNAGTKACDNAGKARMETDSPDAGFKPSGVEEKKDAEDPGNEDSEVPSIEEPRVNQEQDASVNSTNIINTASGENNTNNVYDDDDEDVVQMDGHEQFRCIYACKSCIEGSMLDRKLYRMNTALQIVKSFDIWGWDLLNGKRAIGTKWVYRNKKDERGIVIKNKARLKKALYGLHQAPRAWYETLSTYLLDNGFQRGKIDKTLFIKRVKSDILLVQVYVDDIIFGSTKKSLCIEFENMMHKKFQMSFMGELTFFLGLQVKQKEDGIFIIQDKYVTKILKKFSFTEVKTASTPMETHKPLLKDANGEDVDEHLYRSMIGSLMYLTSSRPDIMFAVCACARYQVNPKVSHLYAVKRIFRYLKGQPKLGLWYPKDSPFDLVAYTDSDYAGASLDRKSTTRGCQFLGCRLISWQCKKQTVVANSTTEAEYIAASNCYGQVLWIQSKLLDYGYNFMQTKIHIDNESTICIVKNLVFHLKTKHIEIMHHFIRDSNEKKLIQMIKIHTDQNVADLLIKAFDVSRFQYLIASTGMFNL
ncbi:putative ribonuclease H-like domain-containing protein [Tanacetum coccineum]